MAAVVRQHSGTKFRSGRFRGRHESGEENIQLNFEKEPEVNVKEILSYIIRQKAFSKAKKLAYLNVFVKLIDTLGDVSKLGFPLRNILICIQASNILKKGQIAVRIRVQCSSSSFLSNSLSVPLVNAAKEVKAGVLRVIKHLINEEASLRVLVELHLDYLIARSTDLCLDNEVERIHAQKLIRKLASTLPQALPRSLVNPLISIGNDGTAERDRMVRASLACICELTYSNPDLVAHCGGISMLLRKILDCNQFPRINESLVATILHLVNYPSTRHFIRINTDLEQLIAPLTDYHFCYTEEASADQTSAEARESRFAASRMAIITVMRSWPGIIRFCRPGGTGLQSLVAILYLPFQEIRQAVLEMLFELFNLTLPEWTSDFNDALLSTDPSKMREDWHLTEGFVANEGKAILPHTAIVRPNLVENHLALLLSAWIGAGILDVLVEVIITSENELFIQAVILLGELLHMANKLLPTECSHHSHYLPSLMSLALSFDIPDVKQHQASVAITYLNHIHSFKKRGPIPCSLYLDQLVKLSESYKNRPLAPNIQKNKLVDMYFRKYVSASDEMCLQTIKDTQVLNTKDTKNWDFDLIEYILKWPDDKMKKLEDQMYVRFIKRLVHFYKPTTHMFSCLDFAHEFGRKFAIVGCLLLDFLVKCEQDDGANILTAFLSDLSLCMSEVAMQRIPVESVLSAHNLVSTLSHYYFLFVGRLSRSTKGDKLVEKSGIYQQFLEIIIAAPQDNYVKLITSSLYYGRQGNCRVILSKALTAASESGRLYSTKLMKVMLRAKVQNFSEWGIELLVTQLYDQSRGVAMSALKVLEEACEIKENLESLVAMKPSFLHLGEKGIMMLCRFMSTSAGFNFLTSANYTMNELKKWHTSFNAHYVKIVEEMLNEAFTTYEKTYDGSYTRRSNRVRQTKDVFVPPHLYGQLVQHRESFALLRKQMYIEQYFECVRCQHCKTLDDVLKMKVALWVVGHISLSSWGVGWLDEEKLVPEVIRLAEECAVYSIRGTAFFVLGMVSSTREGAELLSQYGWESRWNTRSEIWPQVEDRATLLEDSIGEVQSQGGFNVGCSRLEIGSPVSNLDFIAEEQVRFTFDSKDSCEAKNEDYDSESGIHIPDMQQPREYDPKSHQQNNRLQPHAFQVSQSIARSHTLPQKSSHIKSSNHMKGFAISKFDRDRTYSAECILEHKDFVSSQGALHGHTKVKPPKSLSLTKYEFSEEKINVNVTNDTAFDSGAKCNNKNSMCANLESLPENGLNGLILMEGSRHSIAKSEHLTSDKFVVQNNDKLEPKSNFTRLENDGSIELNVTDIHEVPLTLKIDCQNRSNVQCSLAETVTQTGKSNGLCTERSNSGVQNNCDFIETKAQVLQKGLETVVSNAERTLCDSSKMNKNRANSFNTDTTPSSVDSYDSGHNGVFVDMQSLSPTMFTNFLEHSDVQMRPKDKKVHKAHHSTMLRRLSNLSHIPSIKRLSMPAWGLHPTSKFYHTSGHEVNYTSARDAVGYAAVRILRNRTISSDLDSEMGIDSKYGSMSNIARRPSIDSLEFRRPISTLRNFSALSLSEMDNPVNVQLPKASLYHQRPHTGQAEFMGIALPVDINMFFEPHEDDDDLYTDSFIGCGISRQGSIEDQLMIPRKSSRVHSENKTTQLELESQNGNYQEQFESNEKVLKPWTLTSEAAVPELLSSQHNPNRCIQCRGILCDIGLVFPIHPIEEGPEKCDGIKVRSYLSRSRANSTNDQLTDTSSSQTSTTSDSAAGHNKMSFDTSVGRTLVRKEILRLVINLSSSVGVKGAEQGLLSLKQKYPKAFQDLCFYSEVSYLLGSCSFRHAARRFIQELFEDIDISKILGEVYSILGIDDEMEKANTDKTFQEDCDGYTDSFM